MSIFILFKLIIAVIVFGYISDVNALTSVEPFVAYASYLDADNHSLDVLHACLK